MMNCQLLNQSNKRFAKRSIVISKLHAISAMVAFSLVLVMSEPTCDPSVLAKKIEALEQANANSVIAKQININRWSKIIWAFNIVSWSLLFWLCLS